MRIACSRARRSGGAKRSGAEDSGRIPRPDVRRARKVSRVSSRRHAMLEALLATNLTPGLMFPILAAAKLLLQRPSAFQNDARSR